MTVDALKNIAQPKTRKYLYRVGVAVTLGLAAYGVVADEKVGVINAVLAAVFALADANVDDE